VSKWVHHGGHGEHGGGDGRDGCALPFQAWAFWSLGGSCLAHPAAHLSTATQ
jgi:hypothetical protein